MLTAHLPSGYILGRTPPVAGLMPVAILGAVLPDFDILFFYFIDDRAFNHHYYWVHLPIFWVCVAAIVLPLLAWKGYLKAGLVFFAAILMHLLLDTISGGIAWGLPFDDKLFSLVTVPATQSHWILSFMVHWTFLFEIVIWAVAGVLFWRQMRGRRA